MVKKNRYYEYHSEIFLPIAFNKNQFLLNNNCFGFGKPESIYIHKNYEIYSKWRVFMFIVMKLKVRLQLRKRKIYFE